MFFGRIQQLLEGGGELFRAEAELAGKRIKMALVSSAVMLGGVLVLGIGIAVALAGLTIEIAEGWGWPLALGSVGSALAVVGIGLWTFANAKSAGASSVVSMEAPKEEAEVSAPKQDAEEAKEKMKDAVTPDNDTSTDGDSLTDELEHLKKAAVDVATKNPMIVGSAALLAVSLFGPGRTIKLVSRAVAAAGLAASAMDALSGDKDNNNPDENTSPDGPRSDRKRSHQPRPRSFDARKPLTPPRNGL